MSKLPVILLAMIAAVLAGGALYLTVWDVPPPAHTIEKVLPDAALQH